MCGSMVSVGCLLIVVATQHYTVAAQNNGNTTEVWTNPCSQHRCAEGLQCVVHVIACLRPPCPRIGECVPSHPASCHPPCPPGYSCHHQNSIEPAVCIASGDSGGLADPCDGRCLNSSEECVSLIQPCAQPPCSVFSQCVARTRHARAQNNVRFPSGKHRLKRSGACVVPCSGSEQCRPVAAPCARPPCPVIHRCITESAEPAEVSETATNGATDTAAHCLVPCAPFEQCRLAVPARCQQPSCQPIPRCMPTATNNNNINNNNNNGEEDQESGSPSDACQNTRCSDGYRCVMVRCGDRSGAEQNGEDRCARCVANEAQVDQATGEIEPYCPVDTLKHLLGPRACADHHLNTCGGVGGGGGDDCRSGEMCCQRGCGHTCLPACRHACRTQEQCRLVPISCLVSPCPSEPQCVFVGDGRRGDVTTAAASFTPTTTEAEPFPPPPVAPPVLTNTNRWPILGGSKRCGKVVCHADQVCRPEWCSPPTPGCGPGWPLRLHCVSAVPRRPGQCPVTDHSAPGCFTQTGVRDQCSSDFQCADGERCCLLRCARRCVAACEQHSCPNGQLCRTDPSLGISSCQL